MTRKNEHVEYKGYDLEIIRGKPTPMGFRTLIVARKDDKQILSRGDNTKLALEDVKSKIDEATK